MHHLKIKNVFLYIFFVFKNNIIIGDVMDKKDEFKKFVSNHPNIVEFVKNKEMTFQDFYEIYDIYGEDSNVWDKYFNRVGTGDDKIKELTSIFKNINMDNIEKHINNAQKAIGIIQELTKKTPEVKTIVENPVKNIFGD